MAAINRILTLDIGGTGIQAAEFEFDSSNQVTLLRFASAEYQEELDEFNRKHQIGQALEEILRNHEFTARRTIFSISGQFTLSRFVKLPPVSEQEHRVRQIVEFEARQNVPFPIEEVVWDYQLIANPEAEELEVMFVVVKKEIVEDIVAAVQSVGLRPIMVDASFCAAYNAARANGVGIDGCNLVLDIGGRSTNLMFVDRNQFFTRTIPIAGVTITQQIAKELGVDPAEAEEIKLRHGFVGLGGAYEDPASEVAAAVSKIVRGVMTRLHGEINRSITLYRSHQKGARPKKLFLAGGSSIMNFTDQFFAEKLGIEVEYLNPFKVVRVSPAINVQKLEERAHSFSQLVGLALRYRGSCPVEINLIPERIRRQVQLEQKKPYLLGIACAALLVFLLSLLANMHRLQVYEPILDELQEKRQQFEATDRQISTAVRRVDAVRDKYRALESVLRRRQQWAVILNQIETTVPDFLWITRMEPIFERAREEEAVDRRRPASRPGTPFGQPPIRDMEMREFDGEFYGEEARPSEIETEERGPRGRIVGVEISGRSLSLPDRPGASGAGVATDQVAQTEEELGLSPENMPAGPGRQGESVIRTVGPEQLFLASLRNLPIFFETETGFEDYRVSEQVLNLRHFTIRAMLDEPIDLEY